MLDWLRHEGATPVEIDTDGIYFVPPPGVVTEEQARELVSRLSQTFPEGIEVEMDGRYASMFSYKKKNYALLDEAGNMIIRGNGLRSRGIEKYLREFLSAMIRLLLEGKGQQVYRLLDDYNQRLVHHQLE
jgi:DNA polymerase, archaea type